MTATSNVRDPFTGKPKSGEGGVGIREVPSEDVHEARIVALIDLGTHKESFQGGDPKDTRKVYLAFELDEKMSASTFNHIVGQRYTLSFHEKAGLRKLAEAILNEGTSFDADSDRNIDYKALLGQPCMVQIKYTQSADKSKTYANIGTVSAVPKKVRERVFKPKRQPIAWFVGSAMSLIPDWIPYIYGEPATDIISRCHELTKAPAAGDDEGEVSATEESIPF